MSRQNNRLSLVLCQTSLLGLGFLWRKLPACDGRCDVFGKQDAYPTFRIDGALVLSPKTVAEKANDRWHVDRRQRFGGDKTFWQLSL